MKYLRNNEADGVLERLLKAEIGRATRTGAPCSQFDPDLSAAYIERNLTTGERLRYEVHLAACSNCRIQVAALAHAGYHLASDGEAESAESASHAPPLAAERGSVLSRVWTYLLQPQWIAISTAALILLVALPVFVILKNARRQSINRSFPGSTAIGNPDSDKFGYVDAAQTPARDLKAAPDQTESPAGGRYLDRAAGNISVGDTGRAGNEDRLIAKNTESAPAAVTPPDSRASNAASDTETASKKNEAEKPSDSAQVNQAAQSSPSQNQNSQKGLQQNNAEPVSVTAGAVAANQGQDQQRQQQANPPAPASRDYQAARRTDRYAPAQISPKEAQTLPDDKDKKASEVQVLRSGSAGAEVGRSKEGKATIRPNDAQPPKTESTRDETDRRGTIASGPTREFGTRTRGEPDSVRKQPTSPPLTRGQKLERRVENKRFRMQAGVWTDREFKPAKEIPAVTLIRGGELYKAALDKLPALKTFLDSFGADDRVILVYKNVIYRILPAKD
jgi:hypothetical protein